MLCSLAKRGYKSINLKSALTMLDVLFHAVLYRGWLKLTFMVGHLYLMLDCSVRIF